MAGDAPAAVGRDDSLFDADDTAGQIESRRGWGSELDGIGGAQLMSSAEIDCALQDVICDCAREEARDPVWCAGERFRWTLGGPHSVSAAGSSSSSRMRARKRAALAP